MKENEIALPEGWEVVTLRDVGSIVSGGTPSTANPAFWEGNIPWITPADLSGYNCKTLAVGRKSISEAGLKNSSARLIPKGSVLFSSRAPIGYVVIAGAELCTNQGFKSIVPNTKIESAFLYYFLKGSKQAAEDVASGTTFKEISLKSFAALPIPLPPIAEQHRIVSKIEELFSELEKGKEQILLAQQQLKTYRQAVLKWAFEGRLTNADVEDGVLPEGWEWVKLGGLMESVRNGYSKKPDESGNFKILRISSVRPTKLDTSDVRPLLSDIGDENAVQENDLLFTRYNGSIDFVGVAARVPKLTGKLFYPDKLIRCRPKIKDPSHIAYIEYAANALHARAFVLSKLKTTAGQTGIAGSEIKEIPIPLPPLEEQHRIVQEIESRLSVCDAMEATLQTSLAQAEVLRQSILKRAFEGRLG